MIDKERRVICVGDGRRPRRNEGEEGEQRFIYATSRIRHEQIDDRESFLGLSYFGIILL